MRLTRGRPGVWTRWRRLLLAGVVPALLALSCGAVSPPPVVFILIDTLRADYLGCYGFQGPISPAVDALAEESWVFTRCQAPAPWTKPSMASLFTSLYPVSHRVTNHDGRWWGDGSEEIRKGVLAADAVTLAERFRAGGYRTAGFVANPWITAEYGFDQGFDHFDSEGFYPPAEDILARTGAWLETNDREPYFLYLHFMDVHGPYAAPEAAYEAVRSSPSVDSRVVLGRSEFEAIPEYLRNAFWVRGREARDVTTWRGRYAAGMAYLDRRLEGFLDRLRERGVLDRAVVVITSDHGEELYEHGGWNHGRTLFEEQLRVPLIIRPPGGLAARRSLDELVNLVDVMPTVLGLAGLDAPEPSEGDDLRPLMRGERDPESGVSVAAATTEGPELAALTVDRYKLILDQATGERRLFDLAEDPGERADLATAHERLAEELETYLRDVLTAGSRGMFEAAAEEVSEERRALLRSLGYEN